jgi:hypothetical protein
MRYSSCLSEAYSSQTSSGAYEQIERGIDDAPLIGPIFFPVGRGIKKLDRYGGEPPVLLLLSCSNRNHSTEREGKGGTGKGLIKKGSGRLRLTEGARYLEVVVQVVEAGR